MTFLLLYFLLINFSKFFLIFETASSAAAPFKSVVEDAALAEVLGTFDVFVEEIFIFQMATLIHWQQAGQFLC